MMRRLVRWYIGRHPELIDREQVVRRLFDERDVAARITRSWYRVLTERA
jgi:hypothetical protein